MQPGEKGPLKNMTSRQANISATFRKKLCHAANHTPFFGPLANPNTSIPKINRPGDTLSGVAQTLTQKFIYYDFGFIKKKAEGENRPGGSTYS